MNAPALHPWLWGGGAITGWIALLLVQPWRGMWREAWQTLWRMPLLGMVPAGAMVLSHLWARPAMAAGPFITAAALETGDTIATILTGVTTGEAPAMALAAGLLVNAAGLKAGLFRGLNTVFPKPWRRPLQLMLVIGATATLGLPAVRYGAGANGGVWIVKLMAAPWVATATCGMLAWIILAFEAALRSPQKLEKIRWIETSAAYTARMWPFILSGMVAFPLMDVLPEEVRSLLRAVAWPGAVLIAWMPLAFLHTKELGAFRIGARLGMMRFVSHLLAISGWLIITSTVMFAFHVTTGQLRPIGLETVWWSGPLALLFTAMHTWLAVWMLGAWVGIQVDRLPVPVKARRSVPRKVKA